VTPLDYDFLRKLLKERSGLTLSTDKQYLVESRLLPVARKAGLSGLGDLVVRLKGAGADALTGEVVEAMTTNESFFFRDIKPFDQFKAFVLPQIVRARAAQKSIRIWSAACSSGQEPYSIAMTVCEALGEAPRVDLKILATDLDSDVLARARSGVYSADQVKGLGNAQLARFFDSKQEGGICRYVVKHAPARLITFKQLNLMHDLPMRGPLDVIFCRNVVIYFDKETQRRLFQRFARLQRPGDLLFIGHSESMFKVSEAYTLIGRTIYKRNEAPP